MLASTENPVPPCQPDVAELPPTPPPPRRTTNPKGPRGRLRPPSCRKSPGSRWKAIAIGQSPGNWASPAAPSIAGCSSSDSNGRKTPPPTPPNSSPSAWPGSKQSTARPWRPGAVPLPTGK